MVLVKLEEKISKASIIDLNPVSEDSTSDSDWLARFFKNAWEKLPPDS